MDKELSKTHWKSFFEYTYLGSHDLDLGVDLIATVKHVKQESLQVPGSREKNDKPVVYWQEDIKPMVLNVTNSRMLDEIAGSKYVEDWVGKQVAVYIDNNIRFGKDTVEGLRIKRAPKKADPQIAKTMGEIRDELAKLDAATAKTHKDYLNKLKEQKKLTLGAMQAELAKIRKVSV